MEITKEMESEELITLIEEFLYLHNLKETLNTIQSETKVHYVPCPSLEKFESWVLSGSWHTVLPCIHHLPPTLLYPVYEHFIWELRNEGNGKEADRIIEKSGVISHLRTFDKGRFERLENSEKVETTRTDIFEYLVPYLKPSVGVSSSCRLLQLLQNGLKWEYENGISQHSAITSTSKHKTTTIKSENMRAFERTILDSKFGKKNGVEVVKKVEIGGVDAFVAGCRDGFIQVYELESGKLFPLSYQLDKKLMYMNEAVLSLDFADGILASGCINGQIDLWGIESGRKVKSYKIHSDGITCLILHTDHQTSNKQIISASFDGTIKLYGLSAGRQIKEFRGHKGYVNHIKLVGRNEGLEKTYLISASSDKSIKIWNFEMSSCLFTLMCGETIFRIEWVQSKGFFMALSRTRIFGYRISNGNLIFETKLCGDSGKNKEDKGRSSMAEKEVANMHLSHDEKFVHVLFTDGLMKTMTLIGSGGDVKLESIQNGYGKDEHRVVTEGEEVIGSCFFPSVSSIAVYTREGRLKLVQ